MRHILGTAIAVVVLAAPLAAQAADIPTKAPLAAPPTWAGFYLGINAGISVSRNPDNARGDFAVPAIPLAVTPYNETFVHSPIGGVAGAQLGYNTMIAQNWLFGLEVDWQFSRQRDSVCVFDCNRLNAAFFNLGGPGEDTALRSEQRLLWLSTARARLGYATASWLWYATGGLAAGKMQENYSFSATMIPGPPPVFADGVRFAAFSHTRLGWTVGAGVETQLYGGWSAKFEYLYVDLGRVSDAFAINVPLFGITTLPSSFSVNSNIHVTDHIVRAGLNYKLDGVGGGASDTRAFYKAPRTMPASWSGFYAGLNAGYSWRDPWSDQFATFGGTGTATALFASGAFPSRVAGNPEGLLGGIQVGYNVQSGTAVYGLEADIAYGSVKANGATPGPAINPFAAVGPCAGVTCTGQTTMTVDEKLDWLGTVRGRFGYLVTLPMLIYATGGLAYGHAGAAASIGSIVNSPSFQSGNPPVGAPITCPAGAAIVALTPCASGSASKWLVGWTLGAGFEYQLSSAWSWKAEYLFYDLGSLSMAFADPRNPGTTFTGSSQFLGHITRVGVNMKF